MTFGSVRLHVVLNHSTILQEVDGRRKLARRRRLVSFDFCERQALDRQVLDDVALFFFDLVLTYRLERSLDLFNV